MAYFVSGTKYTRVGRAVAGKIRERYRPCETGGRSGGPIGVAAPIVFSFCYGMLSFLKLQFSKQLVGNRGWRQGG